MSWLHQLYETYKECSKVTEFTAGTNPLLPICHTTQNAHLEVVLDGDGNFLRAKVLSKDELLTIVPCTEGSAGRSGSKPVNHPLCDKLQYVAGDYVPAGGTVTIGFSKNPLEPHQNYLSQLAEWVNSSDSHPKAKAIYTYAKKGTLIADLVDAQCLFLNAEQQLIKTWDGEEAAPAVFKIVPPGQTVEAAFVRWRVETPGERETATWKDASLMEAWIRFYNKRESIKGLCMVTGEVAPLATQHPSGIRHGADKAKLISSNDSSGYTFRGRFTDNDGAQACTLSSEVSQKAHNALRWLVQRKQAYRFGDQVFVSWAKSGEDIPDPLADTHAFLSMDDDEEPETFAIGDVGQAFAKRLSRKIAGYHASISDSTNIIVMGVDSATPGRMAITFYRDLEKSEFLARLEQWHKQFAWHQNYSKDVKFVGAPAPRDIAEAAYGRRLDDKLKKAVVERLLPCIVDQADFPRDLMLSTVHRVCNRVGMDAWEWEKTLGIACSLFRGTNQKENYCMSLEEDRTTRDYLYGRLLAVADNIEFHALRQSQEERDTSAGKLMQRFSTNPYETWKVIELALNPYRSRLRANAPKLLGAREKLLDDIMNKFQYEEFTRAKAPLNGEFLLAFHCQRQALRKKAETINTTDTNTQSDD